MESSVNGKGVEVALEEYVDYNAQYRVVICKKCKHCIKPPPGDKRHLKCFHQEWSLSLRKKILQYIAQFHLATPSEVVLPRPKCPPILGLEVSNGWCCEECRYCCISDVNMQQHSKEMHKWIAAKGKRWKPARVQTFFVGPSRRYFEVMEASHPAPRVSECEFSAVRAILEEGERLDLEEAKQVAKMLDNQLAVDNTPWMRKTRWHRKFGGKNILAIAAYALKPSSEEGCLKVVWDSAFRVFGHCKSSISDWRDTEEDGDLILCWLSSPQRDKMNPQPFSIFYESSTHNKYVAYWCRLLCYCLRLLHSDADHGFQFSKTEEQNLRRIWDLVQLGELDEATLDSCVFDLSVSFWSHESRADSKSVITHFTAVLGIDERRGCYRPPTEHGQMLAALLYCGRLLLFEHALPTATRQHITDPYGTFIEVHHRWLIDGKPTPFHYINNLLAYALGAGQGVGGKPRVQWSDDRQDLFYQGQRLALSQFRAFIEGLCHDAEEVLYRDLLFLPDASEIHRLNLRELVDDMNDSTVGTSFVNDPRNHLDGGRERMMRRAMGSVSGRKLFKQGPSGLCLAREGWEVYQRSLARFQALFFPAFHPCSGVPGRGPEVLTIRHTNTPQNMRNIFMLDGQVMWVASHHKSEALTGQHKVIPRFLPTRLGQMLVAYCADVLPFVTLANREAIPPALRSFLWVDQKGLWQTPKATKCLADESSVRLGLRITIQDYRHIAKAIDREHVRGLIGDANDEIDDIHDLAAAHGSDTAENVYGIDASMLRTLTSRTINAFRNVTNRWHQFLRLNSRQQGEGPTKRQRTESSAIHPNKRQRTENQHDIEVELQRGLERLLGPGSTFRNQQQRDGLLAIQRGISPLVFVIPTGGGKSLLFQLPASLPGARATITVVPFRALAKNLLFRCQHLGLDCTHWTSSNQRQARIIIVSADTAVSEAFLTFVSDLQAQGKLGRICFDECHVPLISGSYRRRLLHLDRLRSIPCQIVLLTGSLPPRLEDALADTFLLGSREDGLVYMRAGTDRSNVAYKVMVCDGGDVETTACGLMEQARKTLCDKKLAILFCRSRPTCERVAKRLGCGPYHSTFGEKEDSLATWMDGKEKIMVATSALGTGIDVAGIETIVHLGRPHGIIDYVQEVGRAGRNNETVQSSIVVGRREMEVMRCEDSASHDWNQEGLKGLLLGDKCRREQLGITMDGYGVSCKESEGQLCDLCTGVEARVAEKEREQAETMSWAEQQRQRYGSGPRLWQMKVRERTLERQRIERAIQAVGASCAACWVHGISGDWHDVDRCEVLGAIGEYRAIRRLIRYEANSCCFRCSLPGDWCESYVGRSKCGSRDVIVPMVLAGWTLKATRAVLEAEVGCTELSRLVEWMGKGRVVAGERGTNAVWGVGEIVKVRGEMKGGERFSKE